MAALPQTYYTNYFHSGTSTARSTGDWRWRFELSLISQSSSNNSSYIRIRSYIMFANQPSGAQGRPWLSYYRINNGTTIYGSHVEYAPPQGNSEKLINTRFRTITHNSNGTKTFEIDLAGGYNYYDHNYWMIFALDKFINLPTILRYATITTNVLFWRELTRFAINVGTDVPVDSIQYSLNGGAWTETSTNPYIVSGLTPNTNYNIRTRVKRTDSQLWTESALVYVTTHDIAKMTATQDFNDTQNPVISFSNPSGEQIDLRLGIYGDLKAIRTNITSPYTFVLTEEERNILRNTIPNLTEVDLTYYLDTYNVDSAGWTDYSTKKFSVTNANPTFSNFTYEDTNADTIDLTGNNQTIVKGYSNLRAVITSANKAVPLKYATMNKYRLVVGSKQKEENYHASNTVNIDINAIDNNVFSVYAIDSRNLSTIKQISPSTYLDYNPIILSNANAVRGSGGVGEETTLTFDGSFWNDDFGTVVNTVKTAKYRYKKTSDVSYSDWSSNLTVTPSGNTYSFEGLIAGDEGANGFNIQHSYNIQLMVEDELSSHTFNYVLGSGSPSMALAQGGMAIKAPYDEELGGSLQIDGKKFIDLVYPIGSIYETTSTDLDTTTKMNNHFGGTWEAYGAGRALVAKSADTEFDTIDKTGGAKTHTLTIAQMPSHNHSLDIVGMGESGINEMSQISGERTYKFPVVGNTGGGGAHNNLQPYITVYRYRRTA